ncbi:MAG TPA: 23S rRNA (pseudouridine(1915)-N(3))-methyltransferase RlmH [Candidatus Saccharimonadia bacterium]|nr:23S rRNA (pseudouridine(1915)-N(3))-methyltransferase RlmH [Candidatus Saccharimonadia bacterium]
MKLHIVTIGKPKLAYAITGWDDYLARLQRLHTVRTTHLADKYAKDTAKIREITAGTYVIALEIEGHNFSSPELADFLYKQEIAAHEVSFLIGGPDGLPDEIRSSTHYQWSLSRLTLPHDLAMVVTLEALFRASTINAHLPYHR